MWLVAAAAIVIGAPDVGTVKRVRLSVDGDHGVAALSLAMASNASAAHTASLFIDVPHGSRVTAMRVTIRGRATDARPMPVAVARRRFRDVVDDGLDPALIELVSTTDVTDRLQLRVFPLALRISARVELTLELPAVAVLEVQAPSRVVAQLDGRRIKGRTIRLPARTTTSADPGQRAHVSEAFALLAADEPPAPALVVMPRRDVPWCGLSRY